MAREQVPQGNPDEATVQAVQELEHKRIAAFTALAQIGGIMRQLKNGDSEAVPIDMTHLTSADIRLRHQIPIGRLGDALYDSFINPTIQKLMRWEAGVMRFNHLIGVQLSLMPASRYPQKRVSLILQAGEKEMAEERSLIVQIEPTPQIKWGYRVKDADKEKYVEDKTFGPERIYEIAVAVSGFVASLEPDEVASTQFVSPQQMVAPFH